MRSSEINIMNTASDNDDNDERTGEGSLFGLDAGTS